MHTFGCSRQRVVPAICTVVTALLLAACGDGPRPMVQAPLEIEVTARDYEWHVRYPGTDGVLGTDDDIRDVGSLHVPFGVPTRLHMRSKDYIYTLHLPGQDERQVAIPELEFDIFFTEEDKGEYPMRGDQMCGFSHDSLIGRLYVETEERFWDALERVRPAQ